MARNKKKKTYPKIGKKTVHSDFEYDGYHEVKAYLPKGATVEYESEKLEYTTSHTYKPDVIVEFRCGRKIYLEFKGYFKYEDRAKMLAVREAHPTLDIRFVFQKDQPSCLGKGSKTRPSEWAVKNNFLYAVGSVPPEWIVD